MAFITGAPIVPSIRPSTAKQLISSQRLSHPKLNTSRRANIMKMSANIETAGAGMRIIRQANDATVEKLGCHSWGTWGCEASTFPWTYSSDEVCLVLTGDFTVIPNDGSQSMDVKAGDIAYFPQGMSCTWKVHSEVNKHFKFGIKI